MAHTQSLGLATVIESGCARGQEGDGAHGAYRQLRPKESISHGLTGYPINGTTDWFEHKVETTVAPLPSTGLKAFT